MTELFWHRTSAVWAALMAATLVSWVLGASHGVEDGAVEAATATALAIAFVKVRYVGLEFMEIRRAAAPLRIAFEAWVLFVGGAVVVLHLVA